jgi:3-oxoisoapionate decarboxylase
VQKLGLTSYAYYWACRGDEPMTAAGLIDTTAAQGLAVLQLCDNLPLPLEDAAELHAIREHAEARGIELELGARGLDGDDLHVCVEAVATLGARLLRLVPWSGAAAHEPVAPEQLRRAIVSVLPLCRRHGVALAIENHFALPDEALAALLRDLGDERVGACLDSANSTGYLRQPLHTAALLAPYALSVHLKDFVVRKPVQGYRITGAPLGQGWLDAPAFMEAVRRTGREPNVLLEQWVEPEPSEADVPRREDAWIRQSVAYARDRLGL